MKPLYIFDLDGTLALTEHRQHILDNKDDPQRWQRFFAGRFTTRKPTGPSPAI
jgi:phosphoserine phosphatase